MTRCKTLGLIALLVAAALTTGPGLAEQAAAPVIAPAIAAGQPGCGESQDLDAVLSPPAELCPAASDQAETPVFMAVRRTCKCSCGYPCTTNADCGPGGICSAGISCC